MDIWESNERKQAKQALQNIRKVDIQLERVISTYIDILEREYGNSQMEILELEDEIY